jgi:translocation and assembly module TamB
VLLKGSPKEPRIHGRFEVADGDYENLQTGTILRDLTLGVRFSEDKVYLETLHAGDGENGTLTGKGLFEVIPSKNFPCQGEITLRNFHPVRHDDLTVDTDAEFQIKGDLSSMHIGGEIHLNSAELRFPDRLPPDVAQVERIEKGAPKEQDTEVSRPAPPVRSVVKLDVHMEIPGRAFVRGHGLESEWKGDLKLTGTPAEPELTGTLSVVRGFYDLFGKRFSIKSGGLQFSGPSLPSMDMNAEYQSKDMTARIRLFGDLDKMDLGLSSDPSYPRDEILSRILFGRETSRITPVQALRLAQAANWLAGGKGVFDPLDRTRQLLGVDRLDVRQEGAEAEKTTLSVGKYLRDDVYFELEKGTGTGSGKVSVEVELTPNITLESEAQEDSTGGLGLFWKWDY